MSDFDSEELIPLVADLAGKYTSKDSTSVSYDVARQLMGAVLYCIREAEQEGEEEYKGEAEEAGSLISVDENTDAGILYDRGRILVMEKVMAAKNLYEDIIGDFHAYGSRCYYDTVIKGMPAFFMAYDVRYNPQNHILTLDYPILGGLENRCGIDAIYYYLECVRLEQSFLGRFQEDYVKSVLRHIYSHYGELIINLSSVMMRNTVGHLLLLKPVTEEGFTPGEYEELRVWILGKCDMGECDMEKYDMGKCDMGECDMGECDMGECDMGECDMGERDMGECDMGKCDMGEHVKGILVGEIEDLVVRLCGGDMKLKKYLLMDAGDFVAELINAAEHDCLETIFGC